MKSCSLDFTQTLIDVSEQTGIYVYDKNTNALKIKNPELLSSTDTLRLSKQIANDLNKAVQDILKDFPSGEKVFNVYAYFDADVRNTYYGINYYVSDVVQDRINAYMSSLSEEQITKMNVNRTTIIPNNINLDEQFISNKMSEYIDNISERMNLSAKEKALLQEIKTTTNLKEWLLKNVVLSFIEPQDKELVTKLFNEFPSLDVIQFFRSLNDSKKYAYQTPFLQTISSIISYKNRLNLANQGLEINKVYNLTDVLDTLTNVNEDIISLLKNVFAKYNIKVIFAQRSNGKYFSGDKFALTSNNTIIIASELADKPSVLFSVMLQQALQVALKELPKSLKSTLTKEQYAALLKLNKIRKQIYEDENVFLSDVLVSVFNSRIFNDTYEESADTLNEIVELILSVLTNNVDEKEILRNMIFASLDNIVNLKVRIENVKNVSTAVKEISLEEVDDVNQSLTEAELKVFHKIEQILSELFPEIDVNFRTEIAISDSHYLLLQQSDLLDNINVVDGEAFVDLQIDISLVRDALEELQVAGHESFITNENLLDILYNRQPEILSFSIADITVDKLYSVLKNFGKVKKIKGGVELTINNKTFHFSTLSQSSELNIDALLYNPLTKTLYDEYGILEDLKNNVLRVVTDQPLNVFRLMYLQSRYGFEISEDTFVFIRSLIANGKIDELEQKQIAEFWMKWAVQGSNPHLIFDFLRKSGIGEKYYPHLMMLSSLPQDVEYHPEGNVEIHTRLVLQEVNRIAKENNLTDEERAVLIFSALLHDVGKVHTTEKVYDARKNRYVVTSRKHDKVGSQLAREMLTELGIDSLIIDKISSLIDTHMSHLSFKDDSSIKLIERLKERLGAATILDLIRLVEADMLGRGTERILPTSLNNLISLYNKYNETFGKDFKPIVTGKDLIRHGLRPGPIFKIVLDILKEEQSQGTLTEENKDIRIQQLLSSLHLQTTYRVLGYANIKALEVVIDAVNMRLDTLPHEYAHHYIAWFRNTPIVQEAIKKWGSEEALVQAIGEQAVRQEGCLISIFFTVIERSEKLNDI